MELSINSYINEILKNASDPYFQGLLLFLFSMFPITECRLTIPFGIMIFKLPWYIVFIVCVVANILIGSFLILTLDWFIELFRKNNFLDKIINKIIRRSEGKFDKYQRFKTNGLILFVGIPLPGTGAWTGALVSYILGLNRSLSVLSIIFGVLLSGIIMTILSLTGKAIIAG